MSQVLGLFQMDTNMAQVSARLSDSLPTYIKINSTGGSFWTCSKYTDRIRPVCYNQETLSSQATGSTAISCMLRRAVSPSRHVYLCLDGIANNSLDRTLHRTLGQLRCFSLHIFSSSYLEGVYEWRHGHLSSIVPVPRRLVRPLSREAHFHPIDVK